MKDYPREPEKHFLIACSPRRLIKAFIINSYRCGLDIETLLVFNEASVLMVYFESEVKNLV